MLWFLPLEPMHERYTEQMLRWVVADLKLMALPHRVLLPSEAPAAITTGQWLDTYGTVAYKASQLRMVAQAFAAGEVKYGDVFLVGDVWFPGVEAIRFMADLSGIQVRITGWHYAGCFDPADLLARSLDPWGPAWERWLLRDCLSGVCVGSNFHAGLLRRAAPGVNARAFGLAWDPDEVAAHAVSDGERENIVVFPHRLAPEKQPSLFYDLARVMKRERPDWRFVVSTSSARTPAVPSEVEFVQHKSKADYYRFLARCRIMFSSATQETFGYALHESIALGLSVVAPNRCSYPEGLEHDERFLYVAHRGPDWEARNAEALLRERMTNWVPVPYAYTARWADSTITFLGAIEGGEM